MNRPEFLLLLVGRARTNGFEFRRWYTARLGVPWISQEAAVTLLNTQRRYYALIFSHDFAQAFWKPGSEITFDVPPQTYQRAMPDGTVRTVQRKPYIRRSVRPNAWRYHLRQMATADEPLRYLRKYLHIQEDLAREPSETVTDALTASPEQMVAGMADKKTSSEKRSSPRPLPTDLPAFLQRTYRPSSK